MTHHNKFTRRMGRPPLPEADRERVLAAFEETGTVLGAHKKTGISYGSCWNIIDAKEKEERGSNLHEGSPRSADSGSRSHDTPSEGAA
jgi:molybdenum-dependent DNA-binding transcriptional regulator ModE